MPRSARLRSRRALVAASLAVGGLFATAAATTAQPLEPTPPAASERDDRVSTPATERAWIAARVSAVRPVPHPDAVADDTPRVFAHYDGIDLVEPARDALAIGFHQAGGSHPGLTPVGNIVANENARGTPDTATAADGPDVRVMASRGRRGPGTSAVDVALPPGTPVASVVTGRVTAVERYALYGRYDDVLIEIQPDGRPDVRVMLYHLEDIQVTVGDLVVAGVTPLAGGAHHIPVRNQVDRFAGDCPCAHVDIRIRLV